MAIPEKARRDLAKIMERTGISGTDCRIVESVDGRIYALFHEATGVSPILEWYEWDSIDELSKWFTDAPEGGLSRHIEYERQTIVMFEAWRDRWMTRE